MKNSARMRLLDVSPRFVMGVIVALLLAGAFYAWLAPENPLAGHPENAGYTEYRPGGPNCDPLRLARLSGREADVERGRCEDAAEQHRLNSEGLEQATHSAEAEIAMAKLTYAQTQMMAFGTVMGFLTLLAAFFAVLYARKAGRETQREANASEGQLREAVKVSTAQLRPYVFVDKVTAEINESPLVTVRITVQNYGTIPARSLTVKRDCYFTDSLSDLRPDVLSDEGVDFPVCAHGYDRTANVDTLLLPKDRPGWESNRLVLIIRVRIWYKGMRRYAERFDYFHTPESLGRARPYILTPGLREKQQRRHANLIELMTSKEQA